MLMLPAFTKSQLTKPFEDDTMTKNLIAEKIVDFDEDKLRNGKLAEIIDYLCEFERVLSHKGFSDFELRTEYDWGATSTELYAYRPENDKEYEKRLEREKKAAEKEKMKRAKLKNNEYDEYLRLKKKFDKPDRNRSRRIENQDLKW